MIYLGRFKAGASVFYGANFHNDQGTIEDPTAPEAQQRDYAGTWTALSAPAKQNSKTGFYGGTIDTTAFPAGQYIIRMAGTVATAKTVATVFCFEIEANNNADIKGDTAAIKAKTDVLPSGIKKNTALSNFEFPMIDTNGAPATGLTVTAQRSIDGAAFGACANAVVEVGSGVYKIDLAAADLNGNSVALKFTATGARQRNFTIITEQ